MGDASTPSKMKVEIKPMASEEDIRTCAHLSVKAMATDGYTELKKRYAKKSPFDEVHDTVLNVFRDQSGKFRLFKAVIQAEASSDATAAGSPGCETIVGFTVWKVGYAEVEKVDPFAPREKKQPTPATEPDVTTVAVVPCRDDAALSEPRQTDAAISSTPDTKISLSLYPYADPIEELRRNLGNVYIGTLRGQKHVFLLRLIVDPSYQRLGIGQQLMNWGIATADREHLPAWLFARPAGVTLYKRCGFTTIRAIEADWPGRDFEIATTLAMMRLPVRSGS